MTKVNGELIIRAAELLNVLSTEDASTYEVEFNHDTEVIIVRDATFEEEPVVATLRY